MKDCFENIVYKYEKNFLKIDIFSLDKQKDIFILRNCLGNIKFITEKIPRKDWIKNQKQQDKGSQTNLFFFHQGFSEKETTKRQILLPVGQSFGSGTHESTILAIKLIEKLLKKKKIKFPLDLGTGSGILSFVLNIHLKKKIFATDICEHSINEFKLNSKRNNIKNLFFIKSFGMNNIYLKRKKFDLVVANLLMNEHVFYFAFADKFKKRFFNYFGILVNQKISL